MATSAKNIAVVVKTSYVYAKQVSGANTRKNVGGRDI